MSEQEKTKEIPIAEHKPEGESRIERLANELEKTNGILRDTFSLKMIIIRGLLTGVAIVVGSSVIASILFSILQLVFGDIPSFPGQ